jgi:hypothetical protein
MGTSASLQGSIFDGFEFIEEKSQQSWDQSLARLKEELAQAAPQSVTKQRRRSAKIAELSQSRTLGGVGMKDKNDRRERLKMYVWHDVLHDYTAGMVCVLATSKEEALELIKKKGAQRPEGQQRPQGAWEECRNKEPLVYHEPAVVWVMGGG